MSSDERLFHLLQSVKAILESKSFTRSGYTYTTFTNYNYFTIDGSSSGFNYFIKKPFYVPPVKKGSVCKKNKGLYWLTSLTILVHLTSDLF